MSYYVYIIGYVGQESPCKVGISANPEARCAQLQTGNPHSLCVYWTIECASKEEALAKESSVHAQFADRRLSGEWIDATSEEIVRADWTMPIQKKRSRATQGFSFMGGSEAFHPKPPEDLIGIRKRDMRMIDRCRWWEAFDLPAPPEGFDDWYIVGNPRHGVLGAFPIVGFADEDGDAQ